MYKYCPINLYYRHGLNRGVTGICLQSLRTRNRDRNLSTGDPWKILECKGTLTALIVHPSLPDMLTSKWVSETQAWGILFPSLLRGSLWSEAWIAILVLSLTVSFGGKDTESSSFWASLSLSVKTQDQMIFKGSDLSFYVQQIISEDGSTVPPTSYFFLDIPHSYNKCIHFDKCSPCILLF